MKKIEEKSLSQQFLDMCASPSLSKERDSLNPDGSRPFATFLMQNYLSELDLKEEIAEAGIIAQKNPEPPDHVDALLKPLLMDLEDDHGHGLVSKEPLMDEEEIFTNISIVRMRTNVDDDHSSESMTISEYLSEIDSDKEKRGPRKMAVLVGSTVLVLSIIFFIFLFLNKGIPIQMGTSEIGSPCRADLSFGTITHDNAVSNPIFQSPESDSGSGLTAGRSDPGVYSTKSDQEPKASHAARTEACVVPSVPTHLTPTKHHSSDDSVDEREIIKPVATISELFSPTPTLETDPEVNDAPISVESLANTGLSSIQTVENKPESNKVTVGLIDRSDALRRTGLDVVEHSLPPIPIPSVEEGALVPLTDDVVKPVLIRQHQPRMPLAARRLRKTGKVAIRVLIDEKGYVTKARVVFENPCGYRFGKAALAAVTQNKYIPAQKCGVCVKVWQTLFFDFR